MLEPMSRFVELIHELSGDFGIAFFLLIIGINLVNFGWWFPKKWQASPQFTDQAASTRPLRLSPRTIQVYFVFAAGLFGWFTLEVLFLPETSSWLNLLSGILLIAVIGYILRTVWSLLHQRYP